MCTDMTKHTLKFKEIILNIPGVLCIIPSRELKSEMAQKTKGGRGLEAVADQIKNAFEVANVIVGILGYQTLTEEQIARTSSWRDFYQIMTRGGHLLQRNGRYLWSQTSWSSFDQEALCVSASIPHSSVEFRFSPSSDIQMNTWGEAVEVKGARLFFFGLKWLLPEGETTGYFLGTQFEEAAKDEIFTLVSEVFQKLPLLESRVRVREEYLSEHHILRELDEWRVKQKPDDRREG